MFTQYTFFISLVAIVLMLLFKWFEERKGEDIAWWAKLVSSGDRKIHEYVAIVASKYDLSKKVVTLFLFEFLPAYVYRQTIKFKDYIYKKYYSSAGNLKGEKRMLRSNGTVSEFLQNIAKEEEKSEQIAEDIVDKKEGELK